MKVVVDTNVIVSGFLGGIRAPAEVLTLILSREIVIVYDERIFLEYREVLSRTKFKFRKSSIAAFLDVIQKTGSLSQAYSQPFDLPDSDDNMFLETAAATHVDCVITGNLKHFPFEKRQGVKVVSPAEFILMYRDRKK